MRKLRMLTALCAVFLLAIAFSTAAYAGGFDEPTEEPAAPVAETIAPVTESAAETAVTEPNPFTPAGTGTVIDTATDGNGKEFYTIVTADENVFYLIIDRQRETDNVYFLNAVTEKDLLALAAPDEAGESESAIPETPVTPEPTPTPTPEVLPEPEPVPEPETGGNAGMLIFVVVVILIGSGAGYYFKIYRPEQEKAEPEDDFDYGNVGLDDGNDSPPWYDEDERGMDGDE